MNKNQQFIHFTQPLFGNEEKVELLNSLDSGWVTLGPKTKLFEENFAKYVGAKYAIAVSSNTAGMFLSLKAVGIKPGDEVITTPFTFVATLNTIVQAGAIPILVDIDSKTFNIDVSKIEEKITPKTKAIMPVHYGGLSVNLDEIQAIARKYDIKVIEDAAHASGASYKGRKIGVHSDLSVFSFHPVKNMSTGDGGMITTNNEEYATKIAMLRLHGMSKDAWKRHSASGSWRYDVQIPGYKYNMTDISAALGIHQLNKLDGFIQTRKTYASIYDAAFKDIEEITTPHIPPGEEHIYSLYTIKIDSSKLSISRDEIVEKLKELNIGVSVYFIPAHYFTYYKETYNFTEGDFPVSEKVFEEIISLPLYPKMSEQDIEYVYTTLIDIIKTNRCTFSWKIDEFDTEIFNKKTAKIQKIEINSNPDKTLKTIDSLINELMDNKVEYAVFRTQSENFPLIQALESKGFVTVDGMISLEKKIQSLDEITDTKNINPANTNDLDRLKIIARTVFDKTRVFNDPILNKENSSDMYARWIENSVKGVNADMVLKYTQNDKIVGFITIQKSGHIPLIAVAKEERGKGIAQELLNSAMKILKNWNVENCTIETQVSNIAAMRAYQKAGLRIVDSSSTLRWQSKNI